MYIPAGISFFMRHGARGASGASSTGSVVSPSTPATSSDPSGNQLPTSSRSLFGICGVVGAFLLAIIIWQIRAIYKRRKARAARAARARFSLMYGIKEKPAFVSFADATDDDSPRKSVVLNPAPYEPSVCWKPQIRGVTLPSGVTVPPIAVTHPERSPKVQDEFPPTPKSGPSVSPLPSPPPAHRILGLYTIPLPSFPQESEPAEIPPPTPMHRSPRKGASTPVRESFDLPLVPSPSPRSASFQYITDMLAAPTPRASLASLSASSKSLPRLMVVTTSFESTRHDELGLRTGETLRLIREFDDEWCLVQRVGRLDADKGVVPRLCLSERPRAVKTRNYVRFSNSVLNNVRRK